MDRIDEEEKLKINKERNDIIVDGGVPEIDYNWKGDATRYEVDKIKKSNFKTLIIGIVLSTILSGTSGYTIKNYIDNKDYSHGYSDAYNQAMKVTNPNGKIVNYTIENAPDIVILRYLDYAGSKNNSAYNIAQEAFGYYELFKNDCETIITNKNINSNYSKFRQKASLIIDDVPFDIFKSAIAKNELGEIIVDNTTSIDNDNENCVVYLPTYKKIDTNDLPEGSFVDNGILYVDIKNEASIYHK